MTRHLNHLYQFDDSDGGSDTGDTKPEGPVLWRSRQHPAIEIDQNVDVISDIGHEITNFLRLQGRERILIAGVHVNMCILRRSFGIRQLKAWCWDVALIGDLTDSMYNPERWPYVSHGEGTRLVVEYIREHWCPVVTSQRLMES